jgi:uncharacterized protein involved in outer membrane biogenesis
MDAEQEPVSKFLEYRLFVVLAIVATLVGLYALLGFQWAPKLVRDQAVAFVRENYDRELAVGEVRVQPFKLQLEVRDVALPDADGETMVGFERLFVDFELASLWEGAWVFREIDLQVPVLRTVIRADGSINLADLALPDDPAEPESPTPPLWVQRLAVEAGRLDFVDLARRAPFERLFQPVGFVLEDFRTTPEGGDFRLSARSAAEETFEWKGRFALEPVIASEGDFAVGDLRLPGVAEFLGEVLPFGLTDGLVDIAGSYRVALPEALELDLQLPTIEITSLAMRARGIEEDWIRIPTIVVSDTAVGLPQQAVTIGRVAVTGLAAQAWINPDGTTNIDQLLAPAPAATTPVPAAPAAEPATPATGTVAGAPWTVDIARIDLADAAIDFEDRMEAPAKKFELSPVNLQVSAASLDLSRAVPVSVDAVINGHARFSASGTLTPEPLAASLDVELAKARMEILQPYVLPLADLTITAGELGMKGRLELAPPAGARPELSFQGGLAIDGFRSVDNTLKEPLVDFRRVELQKLSYAMAPDAISIDRVLVDRPYARVIISPERVINIAAVLDPAGTAAALAERRAEAAAEAARTPAQRREIERERKAAEKAAQKARKSGAVTPAPPPAEPAAETLPIRIREVRIDGGRMDFSDQFVQPNFSADIKDLSGTIAGMSSAADSTARVDFAGNLGEFSPVSIAGELQPFDFARYTDLALRFENISLPIFNPYSGPIAGYTIAKGKLTTVLHYRIDERRLDADHNIRIDQLEWGEATATQGEATLPVKFATALLKDRQGVIELDVPVGGTLDDPTFRIGPIVWQIIKNIIVKAVTAPFALLGALFEGAEEAQFVDFAPGEATVDAATTERLEALARSLVEKPQLKLDVPIGMVAELDSPALAERAFEASLAAALAERAGPGGKTDATPPAFESLEPAERIEVLEALVRRQSGAEPVFPESPPPPEGISRSEAKALRQAAALEYLTATARAGAVAAPEDLARLAQERAEAIERALLASGALEPTRVFKVREGKVTAEANRVRFQLGLQ